MANVRIEIKITLDDAGQVNVEGPMENTLAFFGLLEIAKDVVRKYNADLAKSPIMPATREMISLVGKK